MIKVKCKIKTAPGLTPVNPQSLTSKKTCASGLVNKAGADSNITHAAVAKRGYPVINRHALKTAQLFAALLENNWSWDNAVYHLRMAYGLPAVKPAPLESHVTLTTVNYLPVREVHHA